MRHLALVAAGVWLAGSVGQAQDPIKTNPKNYHVVLDNPTAPRALCKNNGETTPTIARRRAPPLARQSSAPTAVCAATNRCGIFRVRIAARGGT